MTDVKQWGVVAWSSLLNAFYGSNNLNISATDVPNLGNVISMYSMFAFCSSLNGPSNINNWDTSKVTSMGYMFYLDSVFNQNIGSWNTANVTNMSFMFYNARAFNQNVAHLLKIYKKDEVVTKKVLK